MDNGIIITIIICLTIIILNILNGDVENGK